MNDQKEKSCVVSSVKKKRRGGNRRITKMDVKNA